MNKLFGPLFTFCFLIVLSPNSAFSQASLEYRQLLKLAQGTRKNDTSVKSYKVKIESKQGIPAAQIEMFLDTKEGRKFIFANKNGEIDIPNTTALFSENPLFVTNQPRGSLEIKSPISIPAFQPPAIVNGRITYQDLFKPILETNKEVQKIDPNFGKEGQPEFVLVIKTDQMIKFIRSMTNKAGQDIVGVRTYQPHEGYVVLAFDEMIYRAKSSSIVEIPGNITFSRKMVDAELAKRIRQTFYDDPEDKNPIRIQASE